jgi:hypothetical protein
VSLCGTELLKNRLLYVFIFNAMQYQMKALLKLLSSFSGYTSLLSYLCRTNHKAYKRCKASRTINTRSDDFFIRHFELLVASHSRKFL